MKTHYVRTASSQALTSDFRSFVFLTDSSESQGSRIPYLLCILSARSSWIFLLFPNAEVPFAIPHKGKNQGNFTGKYCTVLIFGSDGCSDCSCPDLKHHYCLDHLPSPPLKHPFLFWFMRICEGNFRTEEQKNGSPESFWMRLSEEGDREFWWLWNEFRKIGTWESASGFTAGSVRAHAS